ncbi:MAG: CotH kinase family protein [Flavobacteriales bacterium]|nr:CotH kinase family protein [Flavobacteriales bacterium]
MAKKKNRSRKVTWFLSILLVVAVCGSWVADRFLKQRDHPGLRTFVSQWYHNYPKSFAIEPKLLSITVGQYELDRLQSVVDAARERGVIIPEGNEYVDAELSSDGRKFKAKIRIKGKMTDHVKGDKWSFRVIAKKDGGFLGMKRFSLQHPGTRNYLYEWFHQQLAKGEGIVALRYGFIRVEFNGEDRGVYAYEEHFGPDLLENNSRVEGPLFRFDPGLFWVHRLNEMNRLRFNEPFAEYQAAAIDAYGTGDLAKDPEQRKYFEECVALMSEFRHARLPASKVFDADKVARRLALLDVLGGHRSLDWSDAKFYYDPVLQRIEPVAYESFSAQAIVDIAGSGQWSGMQGQWQDIHTAWFSDPVLFRAYVHHLERFADPHYLDSALTALKPALDTAAATIYAEFPYKELDQGTYNRNRRVINAVLNVPKGFHAYRGGIKNDTTTVFAVPIVTLPIEVHMLKLGNGTEVVPVGPAIVPIRTQRRAGDPFTLKFATADTTVFAKDTKLIYSVLGSSKLREMSILPFAFVDGMDTNVWPSKDPAPLSMFSFLHVDEAAGTIQFVSGNHSLDKDLVIPSGYRVSGSAPLHLDLQKGARIISNSPIELFGMEDAPIVIRSSDHIGGYVRLQNTHALSKWRHVRFEGMGSSPNTTQASLQFQESDITLVECTISEDRSRDLLLAIRCSVAITNGQVLGGKDQITLVYAHTVIQNCEVNAADDEALVVKGGDLVVMNSQLNNTAGIGIKISAAAIVSLESVTIGAVNKGIEVNEASSLKASNMVITSGAIGIDVNGEEMRYGPSTVDLIKVDATKADKALTVGKGNTVNMDGKAVGPQK